MNFATKAAIRSLFPEKTVKKHIKEKAIPVTGAGLTKIFEIPGHELEPTEYEHAIKLIRGRDTIYAQVIAVDRAARELRIIKTYNLQDLIDVHIDSISLDEILDKM